MRSKCGVSTFTLNFKRIHGTDFCYLLDTGPEMRAMSVVGWLVLASISAWSMAFERNDDRTDPACFTVCSISFVHQSSGWNSLIGAPT